MARRTARTTHQDATATSAERTRAGTATRASNGHGRPGVERTSSRTPPPSPEQIAARAYEIFLARGGHHGHHEEDWLRAEEELRNTDPSIIPPPASEERER
jgi:hypothetical protein